MQKPTSKIASLNPLVSVRPTDKIEGRGWGNNEAKSAGNENWIGMTTQEWIDWNAQHGRPVGEIIEPPFELQADYITKNHLLLVNGQVLAKTDDPDLWDVVVAKYHPDANDLLKLSLQQEVGLAPKATATGIVLPSRQTSAAVAKYRYGYVGSFADTAWPYLDTVTKATRCNLICWNYHKGVACYVSDALAGGATIREIDPKNVTNGHSDWTVSGIGGSAKNWRYLFYDNAYGNYYLIYDEGGILKRYIIYSNKTVSTSSNFLLKPSGTPNSADWMATDGHRRLTFDGYAAEIDNSDSGSGRFYNGANPHFAISESEYVFTETNDTKLYRGFNANGNTLSDNFGIAFLRFAYPTFDNLHYLFFNDRKNWMYGQNSSGWKLDFMIDGIHRYEDYSADRILGVCKSPDYYFIASGGVTTNTRGNTGVDIYSKKRIQTHRRYFQL